MFRNIISGLVIAILGLAAWRYFGGDFGTVINSVVDVVFTILDVGSTAALEIFEKAKALV